MCLLIPVTDLHGAIDFSSFGVLLYYFVANTASLTQARGNPRYPRFLAIASAIGCLILVTTLPPCPVIAGIIVLAGARLSTDQAASGEALQAVGHNKPDQSPGRRRSIWIVSCHLPARRPHVVRAMRSR